METDIYLLVVYVAPLNSSFAVKSEDLFQLIENDISKLSSIGQILVCGDFNARTSKEPDYCTHDNISDLIDIPVTYTQDIPIHRNNLDVKSVDHHGNQLLELCRSSDMRIVNGRVFGDTLGYHTCFSPNGDPSVIDYFLTSSNMLKNILSLKVYDPSYHSIHCALSLCLQTPRYSIPSIKDICSPLAKFKWHPSFKTHLQLVLSSPLYQEMLSQIQQKCCSINSNDVDSISIGPDEVYSRLEYAHWDLHTRTCTLRSHAHQPPLAPHAWNITKHYLKRHNQCISECQHSIGKWQCYDDSLFEHIHIPMIYDEC